MRRAVRRTSMGTSVVLAIILALAAAPSQASAAEGITGDWEITMDSNGRKTFAQLSITEKTDGALTGKWGESDLSDVRFEGDKLTFVRTISMRDQEFKMTYEGVLKDGKIEGKLSSDRGSFSANGARVKPKLPVLGDWEMKLKIRDQDATATLSISEKPDGALEGKWTGGSGEHVVSDVKFKDGTLTFSRKSKFGDREWTSTYKGAVEGHKLTGTFKSERGEAPANGSRDGADLVGKWDLTTTSERGERTRRLTVYGDMTGRYELFGGESPVKDLKLAGDQVTFKLELGFGEQTFQMVFKGKLDGKTLDGEFTTSRGTTKATG